MYVFHVIDFTPTRKILRYRARVVNTNRRGEKRQMLQERIEKPMAYRREEAARLLGISARKLDQLIAEKEIRSMKVGKRRLISAESLAAFVRKAELAAR
jgi:excisionase family DNA binding protein